jgi:hypothetical protein
MDAGGATGGAADDDAVTKAWGVVLSLQDMMTFYMTLVIAPHPPPGAVDELEPPHQIPVRARPKLDAFCALCPFYHVCQCKGRAYVVWPHESCHWAV